MSEIADKKRASELAQDLEEGPSRLTESYGGEGTTNQHIIEYLNKDERIEDIFTASIKSIAINDKSSGENLHNDGDITYVFTNERILGIMPKEDDDEIYEIPYSSIVDVKNNFGWTKWRMEIKADNYSYHLWLSPSDNDKEKVRRVKDYIFKQDTLQNQESGSTDDELEYSFSAKQKPIKIDIWGEDNKKIRPKEDGQSEFLFEENTFIANIPTESGIKSYNVDYDSIYRLDVTKGFTKNRVDIETKIKTYTFWTKDDIKQSKLLTKVKEGSDSTSKTAEELFDEDEAIEERVKKYDFSIDEVKVKYPEINHSRKLQSSNEEKRLIFTNKRAILTIPKNIMNMNFSINYSEMIDICRKSTDPSELRIYTKSSTYYLTNEVFFPNRNLHNLIYHNISPENNGIAKEITDNEEIEKTRQSRKYGIQLDGEQIRPPKRLYADVVCTDKRIIAYVPDDGENKIYSVDYPDINDISFEDELTAEKITIEAEEILSEEDEYTELTFWGKNSTSSLDRFLSSKTGINKFKLVTSDDKNGTLRVEGWTDGSSDIDANIDATSRTKGESFGVQSGPFFASRNASKSSIEGEISGEISDNTYTTQIERLEIIKDSLRLRSEINLDVHISEINNAFEQDDGLVIEIGSNTFRIEDLPSDAKIGRAVRHIKNQITSSEEETEDSDSDSDSDSNQGEVEENDFTNIDTAEKLRELKDLHENGILTDEEFESKKKELLDEF